MQLYRNLCIFCTTVWFSSEYTFAVWMVAYNNIAGELIKFMQFNL